MTKKQIKDYLVQNKLDKLINFSLKDNYTGKTYATVDGKLQDPYSPQTEDLIRLHQQIRGRKSFTVLEIGVGYSTLVMADALYKNSLDFAALKNPPSIRNRHLFKLFCVDASKKWITFTKKQLPKHLVKLVTFQYSGVSIGTYQDQLCHYYNKMPNVIPDFIYLDAPGPGQVKGSINGMDFDCLERTVMSGDLLLMESTFLPGTFIIVDGRTNNVRFLRNNFIRKYNFHWDKKADISTFELDEDRLGPYNVLGSDLFVGR